MSRNRSIEKRLAWTERLTTCSKHHWLPAAKSCNELTNYCVLICVENCDCCQAVEPALLFGNSELICMFTTSHRLVSFVDYVPLLMDKVTLASSKLRFRSIASAPVPAC